MKLNELVELKKFIRIVEFSPPRGADFNTIFSEAEAVRPYADLIAVTHNPGGKPRIDSHYTSGLLKQEKGVEPICHFRIIDGNRVDLYGKLMATAHMGVKNILVIKGDCPPENIYPGFYQVNDYCHSWEFIADIARLNRGEPTEYMQRLFSPEELEKWRLSYKTDFCIGAAGHPLIAIEPSRISAEASKELEDIRRKVEAGADFILTQIIYDEQVYVKYRDAVYRMLALNGIGKFPPIIPGILPILSLNTLRFLEETIREVSVPERITKAMRESSHPVQDGIRITRDLMQRLQAAGAPGINIFARTKAENLVAILED